eukprot:CAMPEP_0171611044 /NCGR_PEP_ID=MMETSP0990-20121206/10395_1 /TAXON_ID=483369 /ORGANISM="non described non described, Strain CCMP2098" /LENGTH=161 /DNA_ID=CAMNT_0012174539 /DNA_START=231 /DNA_END=716 /DNA_ORIENTATION=-
MAYGAVHIFRMALGPIGNLGAIYAGYLGKYSGTLENSEAFNFAAHLLLPLGLIGFVQHSQMFYERVIRKNQLYEFPLVGVCVLFQVAYSSLLLRWVGLVMASGADNAGTMAYAAYFHIGTVVLTNIIRVYFLSQNDFDAGKMTNNFIVPTCPFMVGADKTA